MGSSKNSQPSGYRYFLSMHMGLCRGPIDSLCAIQVDQKFVWTGNVTTGTQAPNTGILGSQFGDISGGVNINAPTVFGGDTQEGGIQGWFNFYQGDAEQVLEPDNKALMGSPCPEFRGIVSLFYTGQVSSNNPYLKPWKMRVRRSQNGWDSATGTWYATKATISIESCILYFYNLPVAGDTLTLNGKVITWVPYGASTTGAQVQIGQFLANTCRNLINYLNNNTATYGVFGETTPTVNMGVASNDPTDQANPQKYLVQVCTVVLTLSNPQPANSASGGKPYTVATSGRNSNPALGSPTMRPGGILAMNPAHILYEVCTNRTWGRGLPVSYMDDVSFRQAADWLYNEGFGVCIKWSQQDTLSSFIQEIIDMISGALFMNKNTGLMTLKLLRQDYDATNIPFFDANSGLLGVDNDTSASRTQSYNEIIVNYHDPILDVDEQLRCQDLASYTANASTLSKTLDMPGIPTPALAAKIAQRELLQDVSGLKKFTVKLDRSGRMLGPGSVFAFSDPTRNISKMVLRVGKVQDGTPDDQTITLTCMQDVFSLPVTAYMSQSKSSGWVAPNNTPSAVAQAYVGEATYRDMSYYLSAANLAAFPSTSGGITILAVNPALVSATYRIASAASPAEPTTNNLGVWTFGAQLQSPLGLGDLSMTLTNMQGIGLLNPNATSLLFLVGAEWVNVTAFNTTTGVFTIARGCVDTVPTTHVAGEFVYLADYNEGTDGVEYVSGETVDVQLLPLTSQGYLDQSDAPILSVPIVARHQMPYPPGNVTINGTPYAEITAPFLETDIVVAWASRNRIIQADVLIDQTGGNVTPEAGTTYNIQVIFNGAVVRTVTGITGLTWTYTQAMQAEDAVSGLASLTLASEVGGITSFTYYADSIYFANADIGWGDAWGNNWGAPT